MMAEFKKNQNGKFFPDQNSSFMSSETPTLDVETLKTFFLYVRAGAGRPEGRQVGKVTFTFVSCKQGKSICF
jgi:hypothetical protein